jgi:hypothetical protein
MSRRWQGLPSSHQAGIGKTNEEHLDLAAKYASLLEAMHARSLNEPGLSTDEIFQFDITSDISMIRRRSTSSPHSSAVSNETAIDGRGLFTAVDVYGTVDGSNPATAWGAPAAVGHNHESDPAFNLSGQNTKSGAKNMYNPPSPESMSPVYSFLRKRPTSGLTSTMVPPTEPHHPRASMAQELFLDPITNTDISIGNGMNEIAEDELAVMSDVLLDQSFSELDRVITLDGTDFNFDISYWGRNEFV